MAKKKQRRSAFVPRMLVPAAAAMSVVPACVLASCGNVNMPETYVALVAYPTEGGTGGSSTTTTSTTTTSSGNFVAAVAYPAYEAGAD